MQNASYVSHKQIFAWKEGLPLVYDYKNYSAIRTRKCSEIIFPEYFETAG